MKKIGVITDSHSGITQKQAKELDIMVLPMPFYFDDECYYEDVNLSREEFFQKLDSGSKVATSQPSPADVMKLWDEGLEKYEQIVYIPISSGLSGSCAAALAMAQESPYEGKIFVVDNGRVSTPLHRSVLDALELIEEGYTAPEIKEILEKSRDKMVIYVGVETLEHLKRGGRISPATAALGTVLNIKPVLKFDVGTLDTFKKCHGFAKARKAMIEAVQHDLETTFLEWQEKGEVYLLAASSSSKEVTEEWLKEIQEAFPGMEVMCDDLSMGVSCHIGQGGLGIGCSCRPQEEIKAEEGLRNLQIRKSIEEGDGHMLTAAGNVQKDLKLSGLNKQSQKKAEREEKEQQKRLADMDPLVRQLKQYREDAEKMRESNQMASVDAKLKSGEGLTPEEEEYLKQNKPDAYREYQEIRKEREAYKRQLKSCKTKEEVEELKLNKMGNFMAEAKSIANNPVIPKAKKRGLMEKLLKKTMGVQKAHIDFTKTAKYQNLPTEEELTEKVKEKTDAVKKDSSEKKSEDKQAIPGVISEEESEDETVTFEDVKQTITDYLTADRPKGYGLEYYK